MSSWATGQKWWTLCIGSATWENSEDLLVIIWVSINLVSVVVDGFGQDSRSLGSYQHAPTKRSCTHAVDPPVLLKRFGVEERRKPSVR